MSNHRAAAACPYQPPTAPGRRKRREVPRKEASLSCGHTKPHSGGHRLIFYQKLLICKTALTAALGGPAAAAAPKASTFKKRKRSSGGGSSSRGADKGSEGFMQAGGGHTASGKGIQ